MSHIRENEIHALESYLEKINEYLTVAKNTEQDSEKIPRRMLLNANIYLLNLGLSPIIPLFDAEIDELKTLFHLRGMPEKLNAAYFEVCDNGRRGWIFKTRKLLIEESVRLLRNGQPPMTELFSHDIERLISEGEINKADALRFYDNFYDKNDGMNHWIIREGTQLTSNNNLEI